jgi:hypothetical protein
VSDLEALVVGRWYMANYGFSQVCGRCIAVLPHGIVLAFRWGGLSRTWQYVDIHSVIGEVPDPRLLFRLFRFLKNALRAQAQVQS